MSLGGGADRSWMKPLTAEGRVSTDDTDLSNMIGNTQGSGMAYNVINPQPGCEYVYERMDAESFARVRTSGAQFVKTGDPEQAVFTMLAERGEYVMSGKASSLDGTQNNGEVVLVRRPEAVARRLHEQDQHRALMIARGGAEDFVNRASPAERAASGRPTRFRRADHSLQSEDAGGNVVDSWTPDQGIIREG